MERAGVAGQGVTLAEAAEAGEERERRSSSPSPSPSPPPPPSRETPLAPLLAAVAPAAVAVAPAALPPAAVALDDAEGASHPEEEPAVSVPDPLLRWKSRNGAVGDLSGVKWEPRFALQLSMRWWRQTSIGRLQLP